MRLGEATWQDIEAIAARDVSIDDIDRSPGPVLMIPIGSTEQHGPHLPVNTDTLIAEEITQRALHMTDGLIIGPTLAVTASGEHAGFAGTLSIGNRVMEEMVVELVRSADWASGVVVVNGHGGNHRAVTRAIARLENEDRRVLAWWPRWPQRADGGPPDLHAGRIETSMMLAIDPGLVRLERAVTGPDATVDDLRAHGVKAVSPSGVLGDPEGASGREGEHFISEFLNDLIFAIEAWRPLPEDGPGPADHRSGS